MKKRLQGLIAGMLIGTMLTGGAVFAVNTTTLYDVIANGIRIVVDGKKLNPTDVNGNKVEPIIYNGTTYLPVRAVANAFGKAVYWDEPNYTVYLGNGEPLPYPTAYIEDVDNIGDFCYEAESNELTDNYGNSYSSAIKMGGLWKRTFQTLLNRKYSKFKCTLYVPKGCSENTTEKITIKVDGKTIYSSPEISKISSPIEVDLDIRGCNLFEIEYADNDNSSVGHVMGYIGDGGFYQ